jgi:hypothetical protein
MRRALAASVVALALAAPALAQPAKSPAALAALLHKAMQANDADLIGRLVYPGAAPASIQRLVAVAETIRDRKMVLEIRVVAADDKDAIAREGAIFPHRPLEERLREAAERGFKPLLAPQGDLVLAFGLPGARTGNRMTQMYGSHDGACYIVFNVKD